MSDDGHVWQQYWTFGSPRRGSMLTHFDGETWETVDPTGMGASWRPFPFDLGPDGTLWTYFNRARGISDSERSTGMLARWRDGSWTTYTAADGVPPMLDMYGGFEGFLRTAPDGSVWLTPQPIPLRIGSRWTECDGVARFDGAVWSQYLRGYCVYAFDVARDGTAWLHAGPEPDHDGVEDWEADRTLINTFVITPEAVVASQ